MMKRKRDEEEEDWYKAFKMRALEVIKKFILIPFGKKNCNLKFVVISEMGKFLV